MNDNPYASPREQGEVRQVDWRVVERRLRLWTAPFALISTVIASFISFKVTATVGAFAIFICCMGLVSLTLRYFQERRGT